ncbi:co-chaperone GroES [Rubrivirga sp.]|uniref:co-chaperone GroES n=1 Tax=Rubrivirga sp. TaxID=1885344 RepID=UPI003C7737DD
MDFLPSLDSVHVVGDRVLIRPGDDADQSAGGLYLPQGVASKERVQGGRVVKVGPGVVIPNPDYSTAEAWDEASPVRYLPLQARTGDQALFLRKEAIEVEYAGEAFLIVPHQALLALVRPRHIEDEEGF